ncbi:hypothetical protein [Anaerorudis cellulosivorans]|uniref:hypothetical protein n=1 Tax=Anaerorudis cellulosivorans TaxID=3397862 RepID=UPI00221FE983|nr:hypothetical protein [Seramator thermalis]MCW1735255.1 hypothetical protein [Seramator thermalis]
MIAEVREYEYEVRLLIPQTLPRKQLGEMPQHTLHLLPVPTKLHTTQPPPKTLKSQPSPISFHPNLPQTPTSKRQIIIPHLHSEVATYQ